MNNEERRSRIQQAKALEAEIGMPITKSEVDALPEYEGVTDSDRANYLFENAGALADQAVANAREKISNRDLVGDAVDAAFPVPDNATE